MAEVVAQDQMPDAQAVGVGQQIGGEGPGLQGGQVGLAGAVEMVVEPQRVEAHFLGQPGALEDAVVAQGNLGQVEAEIHASHRHTVPWLAGARRQPASRATIWRRSSLPVSVRGSSGQNSIDSGVLDERSCSRTRRLSSSSVTAAGPSGTTTATNR